MIAFVVVGPQDLPKVARWLGRMVRHIRLLLREVKEQIGINELEREITSTKAEIDHDIRTLKDEVDLSHEVNDSAEGLRKELHETDKTLKEE